MRIASWNVNGIRAAVKKGFAASFESLNVDVICIQETKAQDDQVLEALADIDGYRIYTTGWIIWSRPDSWIPSDTSIPTQSNTAGGATAGVLVKTTWDGESIIFLYRSR